MKGERVRGGVSKGGREGIFEGEEEKLLGGRREEAGGRSRTWYDMCGICKQTFPVRQSPHPLSPLWAGVGVAENVRTPPGGAPARRGTYHPFLRTSVVFQPPVMEREREREREREGVGERSGR